MRTYLMILLLAVTCFASASIKDPRHNVKLKPELSQDEVGRQQALMRRQGNVGVAPERTDDSGYVPRSESDPGAAAIVSRRAQDDSSTDAMQVLSQNGEQMKQAAEKPKKTAFGAIWAVLAGLLLAFGVWAGLVKYGPKPPEHLA